MIIGIGTDICALDRIRKMLENDKRELFLKRTYTQKEIELAPKGVGEAAYFGGRWAAKEAVAKALGTGFGRDCGWLDLEILRNERGAPVLELSGKAIQRAQDLDITSWHLSISHEKLYAVAFATAQN